MIIGNAVKQKIKKRGMLKIIRTILFRLSILNDIDFNEKKGILLFISKLEIIIITKKVVLDSITYLKSINKGFSISNGKLTINRALTGAGSPLNWFLTFFVILNFAKRIEVARVIKKLIKPSGTNEIFNSFSKRSKTKFIGWISIPVSKLYITIPGTIPHVIKSAIESNWIPKSLSTLSRREIRPSNKSKKVPRSTKKKTISKKPSKAKYAAKQPLIRFKAVKVLGIILFNDCTKIY